VQIYFQCIKKTANVLYFKKIKRLEAENVNNPATETNLETLSYNGDGHASYTLSQKFLNGKDFEVDNTKGMTYLRMGASQGHYLCQEELAFIYYHGVNIRKDLRLAFLWFKRGEERNKRGEERGSSKLKFHLAQIYHCGVIGGDVQFTKALQLYQDIGVEHLPLVLQQKGLMYEHGDELKKSYSLAYRYYIKSFNQGNFISGYNVALLYFYGKGVKQDSIEAVYWLEKSLDKSTLTHLHYILLETEFSQAATLAGTPRKTYSLVTYDAFIGEILYLLGKIYSDGLGVPRNDEKALLYFKQAGEKGNENAKKYFNENPQ
jgi:TPR repeat protein